MIYTCIHITNHSCHACNEILPRYWLRCTFPSVSFELHASHRFYCLTVSVHPLHHQDIDWPPVRHLKDTVTLPVGIVMFRVASYSSREWHVSFVVPIMGQSIIHNKPRILVLRWLPQSDTRCPRSIYFDYSSTQVWMETCKRLVELTGACCKIGNLTQLSWEKMPCFEGERHFEGGSFSKCHLLGGAVPNISGYSSPWYPDLKGGITMVMPNLN